VCNGIYKIAVLSVITYLLTPCSRVLLEKLVKKFPALYGI